jgi:hypothetical protein
VMMYPPHAARISTRSRTPHWSGSRSRWRVSYTGSSSTSVRVVIMGGLHSRTPSRPGRSSSPRNFRPHGVVSFSDKKAYFR